MKLSEIQNARLKFLKPGELRGSYTDQQLKDLGFKQSENGAWYISQAQWKILVRNKLIN